MNHDEAAAAIHEAFAKAAEHEQHGHVPGPPRIYQLDAVYSDDDHACYPVPTDARPGDVMLIAVGGVTFHRVATGDEDGQWVPDVWRAIGETGTGHLVGPEGWERTPTVDGEQPLADQGFQ